MSKIKFEPHAIRKAIAFAVVEIGFHRVRNIIEFEISAGIEPLIFARADWWKKRRLGQGPRPK
jgi:hypothetical protein